MIPRSLLGVCAAAVAAGTLAQSTAKRPMGLDDLKEVREVSDPQISPDGAWVAYVVEVANTEDDKITGDLWMAKWDGSESVQLTSTKKEDESKPRFSPDGRSLAFLASRGGEDAKAQVHLLNRAGGEARQLTRFEGGVSDYAWAPDSKRLAVIASDPDPDEPKTEEAKKKTRPPIVLDRYQFKQDREGYLRHLREHLYLFDLVTEKAEPLTSGDFDDRLPSWSPDGKMLAFSSKRGEDPDRHDNWDVFVIEARAGAEAKALTTYAGTDADPSFGSPPHFSPDGKSVAYLRGVEPVGGFYDMAQIAVVTAAGGEPRVLAPTLDRPASDLSWSEDGRSILFTFEDDRSQIAGRVAIGGGPVERLTAGGAVVRELTLGPRGRMAMTLSRPHEPREVAVLEAGRLRMLSAQNRDFVGKIAFGAVEGFEVRSKDGTEVHGMLVKPPDFQAGKPYPTIAYIHGGPVSQDGFEFDPMAQMFAARGYLVVQPNYRGSSGRGHAFTRAIFADWGNLEVQDVLGALDDLVRRGLADPERIGIGGWSYGGMTTNYAIATDARFKAAVSGAGVSNMYAAYGTDHYIRQYEGELGLPWQKPEVYAKVSYPFLHADRIKTPTLFMCGEKDFNVPLINSEQMYQAVRSQGIPTRLVIYPGQYHGIVKPSYQRDRMARYLAWYDKYLLGVGTGSPAP